MTPLRTIQWNIKNIKPQENTSWENGSWLDTEQTELTRKEKSQMRSLLEINEIKRRENGVLLKPAS